MPDSPWWYAFVTAAPLAETGEAVNVAVVIGNGHVDQLAFAPGLPRLEGLSSFSERKVFEDLLRALQVDIGRGLGLADLKATLGPQLRVGSRRQLMSAPDAPVVALLVRRYLSSPRVRADDAAKKLVHRSRQVLDGLISRVAHISMTDIQKRPSAAQLYPEVSAFQQAHVPVLGRAIRTEHRDLLLDAVLVEPHRTTLAVRSATERIGRAFWYYDTFRDQVRQESGRDLRLAGLLITSHPDSRDVSDAISYITENWSKHAKVHHALSPNDTQGLREDIRWLADSNRLDA